jgi:hypothetical protein
MAIPVALILGGAAAVGALLLMQKKSGGGAGGVTPAGGGGKGVVPAGGGTSGLTPAEIAQRVQVALQTETDPAKLDEFADSLEPDYHNLAVQLHARANQLRSGGTGQNALPPAGVKDDWAGYDIETFQKTYPEMVSRLEDAPPPHGLIAGEQILIILRPPGGGGPDKWVPAKATVASDRGPDPQATRGYVIAYTQGNIPGGPRAGTELHISTIDESDTYFDISTNADGFIGQFLDAHGWPGILPGTPSGYASGGGGGNEPGGGSGGLGESGGGGGASGYTNA